MGGRRKLYRGVCPSVCHESQRRRHSVTVVNAVVVVAVRICPSVSNSI